MRSLRSQLLLGTAAGAALVLLASGAALYALISRALRSEFDASLASKARSLAVMVEQEHGGLELDFHERRLPEFEPGDEAEFYQVWRTDGDVEARSRSLEDSELKLLRGRPDVPAFGMATFPDGRAGRLVGLTFVPLQEEGSLRKVEPLQVTLVLGRTTAVLEGTLGQIRAVLVGVCLAAVLVTVGVLAWFVRLGLRPVGRLSVQIAGVGESNLSDRLDGQGVPTELEPVVERLNDLLARLGAAFQRERRFTGDVAHELRTPLAGVRSMLEVALSQERGADAYQDTLGDCLKVGLHMQRMVENLLHLARADAGQLEMRREEIPLAPLVRDCWVPLKDRAQACGMTVEWHLEEAAVARADRGCLQMVIQNVLDNAVAHADEGGGVSISARQEGGTVELVISNAGSGLSAGDVEHVFDRFWRGGVARQVSEGHCGLGLPLCKTIVELLAGTIEAASAAGVFTIKIKLPGARRG